MANLKIGTFNLLNLALPEVRFYGDEHYSPGQFAKKLEWTAGRLRQMDADVVGFQEVWQQEALRRVCTASGRFTADQVKAPRADASGPTLTEGPFVGIASRLPFMDEPQSVADFPAGLDKPFDGLALPVGRFSRPVLKARLAIPHRQGQSIVVFVAHLKSKRALVDPSAAQDDQREDALGKARSLIRRASEAAALRFLVLDELVGNRQPVIVLGDLNDGEQAVTTEMIEGSRPYRFWPDARKQKIWDALLYDAWELHAARSTKDVSYTNIFNASYQNLDHILVSQEFVAANPAHIAQLIDLRYYNDQLIDSTLSDERPTRTESDHGQIVAEIRMDQSQPGSGPA